MTNPITWLLDKWNESPSGRLIRRNDREQRIVPVIDANGDIVPNELGALPDVEEILAEHEYSNGQKFNLIHHWKAVDPVDMGEQIKNTYCQVDVKTCKTVHRVYTELQNRSIGPSEDSVTSRCANLKKSRQFHPNRRREGAPDKQAFDPMQPLANIDPEALAGLATLVDHLKQSGVIPQPVPSGP